MISLLTSLKPFRGEAIRLQENALANWRRLGADVEIIIYGGGEGIAERAQRFGARHVPDIHGNLKGIPDFAAIAKHAAAHAKYDRQVYLNGDILLPPDFVEQVNRVIYQDFLVVGQRIDLSQEAVFNPLAADWNGEIMGCCRTGHAHLHNSSGQDYFVFPRGLWKDLLPLIVGRGGYDNALVAFCLRRRIPIVDATWVLHVVHQWHDYSHVKGSAETFQGTDALANAHLHDIEHSKPDIEDADWRMTLEHIVKSPGSSNPFRRIEVQLRYRMSLKVVSYGLRAITRMAWFVGCLKPRNLPLESIIECQD